MKEITYTDENGNFIEISKDGYVFINGSCVAEPGTDRDFDNYAVEVQNGDGYYDDYGNYQSYYKE